MYPRGQDQRDRRTGAGEKCARQAEVKGLSGLLKHDYLLGVILTGTFLCYKYSVPHMIREKMGTSDQHRLAPRKSCVAIQGCLCRSETRDEVVRKIMLEPAAIRRCSNRRKLPPWRSTCARIRQPELRALRLISIWAGRRAKRKIEKTRDFE